MCVDLKKLLQWIFDTCIYLQYCNSLTINDNRDVRTAYNRLTLALK